MCLQKYKGISTYPKCVNHLSNPRECTMRKVNPEVNSGLQLKIVYQYQLISCNKCITLMLVVNNRGNYEVGGKGCGSALDFPLNFAVNLKQLFKKSLLIFLKKGMKYWYRFANLKHNANMSDSL